MNNKIKFTILFLALGILGAVIFSQVTSVQAQWFYWTPSYSTPPYSTPAYTTPLYSSPVYTSPPYGLQGYNYQDEQGDTCEFFFSCAVYDAQGVCDFFPWACVYSQYTSPA